MTIFNTLLSKIFGAATPATVGTTPALPAATTASAEVVPSTVAAPAHIDVTAYLDGLAAKNPEALDWKHSIVDLLKLVDMDSSHAARLQMAKELHYSGDMEDSAAMNIWLHQQVLAKLAENGGKISPELLHQS